MGWEQRFIVTFSPKYKYYQREIRQRQIDRAVKIVEQEKGISTRNLNRSKPFVEEIQMTIDGVIAEKQISVLCAHFLPLNFNFILHILLFILEILRYNKKGIAHSFIR